MSNSGSGYGGGFNTVPTELDYWKLLDELTVTDAAILVTGHDPSEYDYLYDENGEPLRTKEGQHQTKQKTSHKGFMPAFKALRLAVLGNRLKAKLAFAATYTTEVDTSFYAKGDVHYSSFEVSTGDDVVAVNFDHMLVTNGGCESILSTSDFPQNATEINVIREPLWDQTTIRVEDLREWLAERGFPAPFFNIKMKKDGFRDPKHPRYAPKLAACIAAWEAVTVAAKNASVKQTLSDWLRSNAAAYGAANTDGIVSPTVAEELAAVANWNPKGGANPTGGSELEAETSERQLVDNLAHKKLPSEIDSDIPF